jgi:hypothetical protein
VGAAAGDPSTVEAIADVAQVVIGVAALVSLWIALVSLREVRRERIQRAQPWLAFEHGGQVVQWKEVETTKLPGYNPASIKSLVGDRPRNVRDPIGTWGRLRNHGSGVALQTKITFVTASATVGVETFRIEPDKLDEFPYDLFFNQIPASPSHIHPGEEGRFSRIPTPIFEQQGNRRIINGLVVIRCQDTLDARHVRYQRFRVGVHDHGTLTITFSDEYDHEEARAYLGDLAKKVPELKTKQRSQTAEQMRRVLLGSPSSSSE